MKIPTRNSFPTEGNEAALKKMLKPGAREPVSHQSGTNEMKPHVTRHPAFGKLGQRSQQG